MKMKKVVISMATTLLLALSCSPIQSFAAPEEPTTVAEATSSETSPTSETNETTTDPDWQKLRDNYQDEIFKALEEQEKKEKKTPDDYYNDPYYDTDGNAELIESKGYKVIYSSAELLFTAVTTKDGHIFYIIINYADEDGKDNVYFLNKVDDFDLYSLLNNKTTPTDGKNSGESKKSSAEEYLSQKTTTVSGNNSESTTTSAKNTNSGGSKLKLIFLLVLVVAIGAAGWIIPKFMNRPKKNQVEFEDDELEEVNEDEM